MPKSVFTDAYRSFLEVLIKARVNARISQIELAERLGRTQTWVSQVERGKRRLDVVEFYAFARALRVDPVELYSAVVSHMPDHVEI